MQKTSTYFRNKKFWLVMLLILASGSPLLKVFEYIYVIATFFVIIWSLKHKVSILKNIIPLCLGILCIFFLQLLVLGWISWPGVVNFLSKVIFGAFVILVTGYAFRKLYLDCMYVLAVISLFFWGLYVTTGIIFDFFPFIEGHPNILLYGMRSNEMAAFRNCGAFWEPGAYACYLMLVPVFYTNNISELWKKEKKKCIVLMIALLSTQSTTGYITFMVFILIILIFRLKTHAKYFILPVLLAGIYYVYFNLDFLQEKISYQTERSLEANARGEFSSQRLGSLLFDWYYIEKHPLVGNGLHEKTRYADHLWLAELWKKGELAQSGNGFSNLIASMGLLFIGLYGYFFYKNRKQTSFTGKDYLIFFTILVLLLQGEPLNNYPLFLGLPFLKINSDI